MRIIEINTDATTLSKIVDYLNTLEVKFIVKETEDEAYDPEFVEMVLDRSIKAKQGESIVYTDDLRKTFFNTQL